MPFLIHAIFNWIKNQPHTQTGRFTNDQKPFQWALNVVFWVCFVTLGYKKDICLHSLGGLASKMS